jgi:hypothetical protein
MSETTGAKTGPWTEAEVLRLRRLNRTGHSYSEIAADLGRTRNSCIGKANKLGIPGHDRGEQCRKAYERRQRALAAGSYEEAA